MTSPPYPYPSPYHHLRVPALPHPNSPPPPPKVREGEEDLPDQPPPERRLKEWWPFDRMRPMPPPPPEGWADSLAVGDCVNLNHEGGWWDVSVRGVPARAPAASGGRGRGGRGGKGGRAKDARAPKEGGGLFRVCYEALGAEHEASLPPLFPAAFPRLFSPPLFRGVFVICFVVLSHFAPFARVCHTRPSPRLATKKRKKRINFRHMGETGCDIWGKGD